MSAVDYAVTFGYKAQDGYYYGPNGKVGKYHRGNDRPCPTGTPIVISGVTIGLTGATGLVSGPHLHTQACTAGKNYADDFDPSPFEFKNGIVVVADYHSQFGNRIVIRVGGVDITYAHLSKISVAVGQYIGDEMITKDDVGLLRIGHSEIGGWDVNKTHAGDYDALFLGAWQGKPVKDFIWAQWNAGAPYRTAKEAQAKAIQDLQNTVNNLSSRPTKEELQKALDNVAVANQKVIDAEKARDEAIAKQTGDTQLLDEGRGVFSWITKLIERLKK